MTDTVSSPQVSVRVAVGLSVASAACALTFLALAAPYTTYTKLVALSLFGICALVSSTTELPRAVSYRLVGLSLLALALMPSFGADLWWMAVPLVVLGVASAELSTLVRVVIAMPMVLISMVFNAGASVSPYLIAGWAIGTTTMLLSANQLSVVGATRRFDTVSDLHCMIDGVQRKAPTGWRWCRRPASALVAIVLIIPAAIGFGYSVDVRLPQFPGLARIGQVGPTLESHPGLRGSLDVGDPVELSDDVVLRVESDRSLFWRATTYEDWNGRTWTSPDRLQTISWPGQGVRPIDAGLPDVTVETEKVVQSFRTEQAGFDVVLGAPEIDVVWVAADSAQVSDNGSIWLNEPLGAKAEWTVESTVALVNEDILRQSDEIGFEAYPGILPRYAVESNVSAEVVELAHQITADAPTTYDKVRAIEQWMDDNIVYDRNIRSLPDGNDAVSELLFETQVGFCEQIASALVVMLRSLGIPARIAVGYVSSERDRTTGEWISRGSDAHAWAEVYFPGIGWQGFDPTAGVPLSGERSAPSPGVISLEWNAAMGGVTVATVFLIFLATVLGLRRILNQSLVPKAHKIQQRFNRCGARLGYEWTPAMTLTDRADDLTAVGVDPSLVTEIVHYLQHLHYSDVEESGTDRNNDVERLIEVLEEQCDHTESRQLQPQN